MREKRRKAKVFGTGQSKPQKVAQEPGAFSPFFSPPVQPEIIRAPVTILPRIWTSAFFRHFCYNGLDRLFNEEKGVEMMPYNALKEAHVGGWEVAFVLLIVGYILYRLGKAKAGKIVHMLLRLMIVIILVSGAWLLFQYHTSDFYYYVKGILAIVLFGLMEMSLGRARRNEGSIGFFIGALVVMVLVIMLGYRVFA